MGALVHVEFQLALLVKRLQAQPIALVAVCFAPVNNVCLLALAAPLPERVLCALARLHNSVIRAQPSPEAWQISAPGHQMHLWPFGFVFPAQPLQPCVESDLQYGSVFMVTPVADETMPTKTATRAAMPNWSFIRGIAAIKDSNQ